MIRDAEQVKECMPTEKPYLHRSPYGKFAQISQVAIDCTIATHAVMLSGVKQGTHS